jgi:hypothetical protein
VGGGERAKPADKEPELMKVIEDAIDIVNSIRYKRRSPF